MSEPEPNSTTPSQQLVDSWDRQLKKLDERLRASGRTVEVVEPADTNEFVVTFPQGRRPRTLHLAGVPKRGPVTVGVEWAYEIHSLEVRPRTWQRILRGERVSLEKAEYWEGTRFRYVWTFGGLDSLDVSYDDGGCAFTGRLAKPMSRTLLERGSA